jgi:long-chain acyl-CoA synthetase
MTRPTVFGVRLAQYALDAQAPPAMVMPGRKVTYAELHRNVEACAAWLTREGCLPSEVAGITIADEYLHMVASLALLSLGIPQVCLPTHDPVSMRMHLAQRLAVGRVIVTDLQHALPGRQVLPLAPESLGSTANVAVADAADADPDAPAIYFTSSGTTGEPKIYAMSQHALAWRAERMVESEAMASGFRVLMPVSVEDAPAKAKRLYTLHHGLTSVFQSAPSSSRVSLQELCASLDVTCLELTVLQLSSVVLDHSQSRPFPARTTVYASGSRVPAELRRSFRARFAAPLFIHYGAREFGRITTTYPDGDVDALATVGRPAPWIDLEIVDRDGKLVPAGEVGELRVRSECMTREYHGDAVATSRHFRDGWFYPGDLGSLTAGGALCLHGRTDDMMNLNSIKIFPAEIERVLEEHPAVRAAAAFAKTSTAHGDIPVAAVELHASATVGVEELMERARARLGVRAPRRIIVVDALPRNAAGKIVKHELIRLIVPDK